MKKPFLASFGAHATLLYLAAFGIPMLHIPSCAGKFGGQPPGGGPTAEQGKGQEQPKVVEVEFLPAPKKEEVAEVEPELDADGMMRKLHNSSRCPDWYGGIGIVNSLNWGKAGEDTYYFVSKVAPTYPADRAGVQAGDRIISPDPGAIRGEVGTNFTLVLKRGDAILTLNMVREKICTEKEKP